MSSLKKNGKSGIKRSTVINNRMAKIDNHGMAITTADKSVLHVNNSSDFQHQLCNVTSKSRHSFLVSSSLRRDEPLLGFFFCSEEDKECANFFSNHWNSIDKLSGESCHLFTLRTKIDKVIFFSPSGEEINNSSSMLESERIRKDIFNEIKEVRYPSLLLFCRISISEAKDAVVYHLDDKSSNEIYSSIQMIISYWKDLDGTTSDKFSSLRSYLLKGTLKDRIGNFVMSSAPTLTRMVMEMYKP